MRDQLDTMRDRGAFDPGDAFDRRLARAVHTFADQAATAVDAAAVAERVARDGRRRTPWAVLGREVPVPIAMLLAMGLLLLLALATLTAGGLGDRRPMTTVPDTNAVEPALGLPSLEPLAVTDGTGPETIAAHEALTLAFDDAAAGTNGGDTVQLRDAAIAVMTDSNDPRTTGVGTWLLQGDFPALGAGPRDLGAAAVHGAFRLTADGDSWDGSCTGFATDGLHAITGSCWLTGSGDFDGLTWYRQFTWRLSDHWDRAAGISRGVIYPGEPPAR